MKTFKFSLFLVLIYFSNSHAKQKHVDCEKPPEVENASIVVSYDDSEEFVTATYRCHEGFKLAGKGEITCDIDTDEWQESPPSCEPDTGESDDKSTADSKKRRKNKVHEIKEESQITNDFAQHLDLSCMSKGLVKAPSINNGFIAKYNRRRKGEKLFLVAFYECDEDFELGNLEQDRLYCSREKWVGDTPKCMPVNDENGDDEEDYSDGNGNVSGGESEDEAENKKKDESAKDNEIPLDTHRDHRNEIEKSTTQAPQSTTNLTLPCDSDRGGCEHECQMVKYYYDPEPIIQCSCYTGFILDEYDGRRCHDINECDSNPGCEQICNNLPGTFECACHPGLQIDTTNNKKCVVSECPTDINECLENPSVCGGNECENSYGTFTCIEPQTTTQPPTTQPPATTTETTTTSTTVQSMKTIEDSDDQEEGDGEEDEEDQGSEENEIETENVDQRENGDKQEHEHVNGKNTELEAHPTLEPVIHVTTPQTTRHTTTTELSNEISGQDESENESGEDSGREDSGREDERYPEVKRENHTELHHQSSTVKSNVGSECDDGLTFDSHGKCVEAETSTSLAHTPHVVETSTTAEPHHVAEIKPICQHVDDEGVECHCPYGYEISEDESACQDVNECDEYDEEDEDGNASGATFCSHTCTNLIGSYLCSCPENFHIHDDKRTCVRDYCADLDNIQLDKTKCSHGCADEPEGYSCRCPSGFTLQNDYKTCKEDVAEETNGVEREKDYEDNEVEEESESIVECSSDDHENCSPGNCVVVGTGKECTCPSGFERKSKQCVDVDECEHGLHQCSHSCHNTVGGFKCSCPHGLRLSEDEKMCDDFDECTSDEDICGSLECRNTYGSYKCICRDGEEIDEHGKCRKPNLCEHHNGGCSHSCQTHHDEILCECPEDMDLDDDMKTCVKADPCHVVPNGGCSHYCDSSLETICYCPPGHTLDSGLVCKEDFKCEEGFKLSPHDRKMCIDVDECSEINNICLNGHCENTEGSFMCHCQSGYQLSEHNKTCIDIDECAREVSPCSHRCLNLPGSFQCGCPYGQVLIEDGSNCGFSDLCDFNNGGCAHECDFLDNKISCSCHKGYRVDDDDNKNCVDVKECEENNGGCQQKCTNTEGSFYCSCHDGYKLNKNRCDDDDECVENNGNCSNICINLIGSHVCACEAGFMLGSDNVTCQDVDECQDLHDCSHICINTEGTYECSCPSGFVLGHDQFNCHDVDECLSSPCLEGHCVNTLGSFHCQCSPGYELFVEEKTCVDKNECLDTPCSHHCVNLPGSFNCSCPKGMELNDDSLTCNDVDECEVDSPCSHICENTEKSFLCKCPEGFVLNDDERTCSCSSGLVLSGDGLSCQSSDPCSIGNGGCSQICEFNQNLIVCSCRNGFEIDSNDKTQCNDINECQEKNKCQQECVNTIGSYKCECFPGFRFNSFDQCIDIDECKMENFRCPSAAQCFNTAGSYKCICTDGFKLSRDKSECIEIKNECKPLLVKNGEARCTRSRHKSQLFYRTKCFFTCDKGYKLHGPSIKHCNGTGHWDDSGNPTCVPLACPRLSKPEHGTILPANCMSGDTFSGERCFLHCPAGYKAFGKRVAVCNNLQWHPRAELKCVPVPSRAPAAAQLTPVASSSHHEQQSSSSHHLQQHQLQQQQHQQQQHHHHRPTIKCPDDMTIIKPKNQDTILVRISKPETNVDWSKYVDSQPKWAKRLEATLSVGATEVTFRARSPTSSQFDICRVIINVIDPTPPTVTFCPEPFIVDLLPHEESRPIFWEEPTFESKQTIKQIFKSKVPGHRFHAGVHPITYVASTQEGLSAKCSFRVTVKGHEVPYHSQKVSLETNMITDESPEVHLENHESFLVCPGKHPIKIKANQPVRPQRVQPYPRQRPLKKLHQGIPQHQHQLQENVGYNEKFAAARNNRRNNRLRLYSLWDANNPQQSNVNQRSFQRIHNSAPVAHWN